jgi:hypothetical protein
VADGRLQRLVDERDVIARLYAYCAAADAQTPDAFLDCFTADGEFIYRAGADAEPAIHLRGRAEIERWFAERLPSFPAGTMNHTTIHPHADVQGDEATATSWFISIRNGESGPYIASTGGYRDRLVRCDDGAWRFARRVSTGDLPH